jgi:hypothetical protein
VIITSTQVEQERLRQEAIKQAEKERRDKYKKQEEDREVLRQGIRDKVSCSCYFCFYLPGTALMGFKLALYLPWL